MNRTKIEWCDYTINPVKGYCPMACPYCYARRMYDRFGWDKTIRFEQSAFFTLPSKPSRIFVGSTIELFGDWIYPEWLETIFTICRQHSEDTFIFLTKQPQNLQKWSPFPQNAWVGASATDLKSFLFARSYFRELKAEVKLFSFEPLLGQIPLGGIWAEEVNWLIIGAETGNRKGKSPLEQVQSWAREIIAAADEAGIPVFLKDNLHYPIKRQEFPDR